MIGQGRGQVVTRFCTSAGRYSTGQISKHLIFHRYAAPRKKKRLEWHGWKELPCKCAQALRFMLTSTIQCLHRKWGWVCCWCGPAVSISFARALRLRYKNWWGRLGQGRVGAWKLSFKLGQTPAAVPQRGWIGLGWGVEWQSCAY